jgi:hypothetical protein
MQWTVDLPGDASDAIGEWRWSVTVVRHGVAEDVVARSDEWTFYYNPFGGGPAPFTSPLSSPLSTPAP